MNLSAEMEIPQKRGIVGEILSFRVEDDGQFIVEIMLVNTKKLLPSTVCVIATIYNEAYDMIKKIEAKHPIKLAGSYMSGDSRVVVRLFSHLDEEERSKACILEVRLV